MTEKDLEELMEKHRDAPWGIKCSISMKRKIKKNLREIRNIAVSAAMNRVEIMASDQIPDHILFFCSEGWEIYKMINLKNRGAYVPFSGMN